MTELQWIDVSRKLNDAGVLLLHVERSFNRYEVHGELAKLLHKLEDDLLSIEEKVEEHRANLHCYVV